MVDSIAPKLYYDCLLSWKRQWDKSKLQRTQEARLYRLLKHANRESKYYRRLFRNRDINPQQVLKKGLNTIPTLSKHDMLENFERIITQSSKRHYAVHHSAGSTGTPAKVFHGQRSLYFQDVTRIRRWLSWGAKPGHSHLLVQPADNTRKTGSFCSKLDKRLMNRIWFYFTSLPPRSVDLLEVSRFLERVRIGLLYSPPFILAALADSISSHPQRRLGPSKIITGSELLYEDLRSYVEMKLGIPVVDGYGLVELGVIAWQCGSSRAYHIDADDVIVEVLRNGTPVTNQPGEIVVTSLHNNVMPLIRYRTGDAGILMNTKCACGRALPLLLSIEGRLADHLICANGNIISPRKIADALSGIFSTDFQIVQESIDKILINLPHSRLSEAASNATRKILTAQLGTEVDVRFETSGQTAITHGRKQRVVISQCLGHKDHRNQCSRRFGNDSSWNSGKDFTTIA